MPRQYRIASIPADGIGPEVISAGLEVLDAVAARDSGFNLVIDHYDWGSNWYRKHGEFMPADGLAWLRTADAIYFGAVGDPDIPDHITLWGLRLPICQGLDQYPTSARHASCPASPRRCATQVPATSTG